MNPSIHGPHANLSIKNLVPLSKSANHIEWLNDRRSHRFSHDTLLHFLLYKFITCSQSPSLLFPTFNKSQILQKVLLIPFLLENLQNHFPFLFPHPSLFIISPFLPFSSLNRTLELGFLQHQWRSGGRFLSSDSPTRSAASCSCSFLQTSLPSTSMPLTVISQSLDLSILVRLFLRFVCVLDFSWNSMHDFAVVLDDGSQTKENGFIYVSRLKRWFRFSWFLFF